jgi:hypothetical protein
MSFGRGKLAHRVVHPQVHGFIRIERRHAGCEAEEAGLAAALRKWAHGRPVSHIPPILCSRETDIRYGQPGKVNLDRLTITSKGFQFLLEDRQTQLWQILMYYLTLKEVRFRAFLSQHG